MVSDLRCESIIFVFWVFYICILSLDTLLIFTHTFTSSSFLHLLHKNYSTMPTNVVSVYLRFLHSGPTKTKSPNLLPFPNLSAQAQAQQPSTAVTVGSSLFGPTPPSALLELRLPAHPAFSPAPPLPALLELRPPARRSAQHRRRLPCSSSGHPPAGPGPPQQALLELRPPARPVCVGPALATPPTKPGRPTQRNDTPLRASPHAISTNAPRSTQATLPKLTYSTERGGWSSSQARQPRSGACRLCSVGAGDSKCRGPTANAGRDSSRWILASSDASILSNVLMTTPDAEARTASATWPTKPHSASVSLPSSMLRNVAALSVRSGSAGTPSRCAARSAE
jgi:hypothetical protein